MKFVVTGGASGVGEALVNRLQDHDVWILDVQAPQRLANGHTFVETDLSSPGAINQTLSSLPDKIDGLANVAGIAQASDPTKVVAVNFLALRHLSQSLSPRLSQKGRIVNVSSVAGRDWQPRHERLMPMLKTRSFEEGLDWCHQHIDFVQRDAYTLSKRLVTAYTLQAAQDAVKGGYTVNCVSPGPIETPLYPQFESMMGEAHSNWMKAQAGRGATPNDIAEVIDLLLTGECNWLNGVDIPVDGGYSAGIDTGWIDFSQSPIMLARQERSR